MQLDARGNGIFLHPRKRRAAEALCCHPVEPDPAEMAERCGAETAVPEGISGLSAAGAAGDRSTWSSEGWSGANPYLLAETMIDGGSPMLARLNRRGRLDTDLAHVCYRAVRVAVKRHAHRVGHALVEVRGFRVL